MWTAMIGHIDVDSNDWTHNDWTNNSNDWTLKCGQL